jgi:SAM-dependent methyltransferase
MGEVALRPMFEPALDDPEGLLDVTRERLLSGGEVGPAMDMLSDGLWWLRRTPCGPEWAEVVGLLRAHPLLELLHQNPLARRAFVKPRGYPGDAPLVDMFLHGAEADEAREASPLGRMLLLRDHATPFAAAMRERRDYLTALIDDVANAVAMPHVLAVGAGHLRELQLSLAVRRRRIGRFVALDQDAEALERGVHDCAAPWVEAVARGPGAAMDGTFAPDAFDLVYAGGVFDTLRGGYAHRLVRALFALLRPGGRLVVSNGVPDQYDVGYIEAVGDWSMIYRGPGEMLDLASLVEAEDVALRRVYTRRSPEIFYLELRRRCGR